MNGVADVQRVVGTYFNIPKSELLSSSRKRSLARPRQVAMVLARRYTGASLPRLGQMFGGRDHTTVIHAIRRMPEYLAESPKLERQFHQLNSMLSHIVCLPAATLMCEQAVAEFEDRA